MPPGTRGVSTLCCRPALRVSRTFPGRRDQVAAARRFVWSVLLTCPSANDAVLLTSELAANAVLHTASGDSGSFGVAVRHTDGLALVEVTDGGSVTAPTVGANGELGVCGRGLLLVSMVASRWGHDGDSSARLVWFELDCG
jgi:anti-sigma regulatory factor (Ser/Thr protein kinase)